MNQEKNINFKFKVLIIEIISIIILSYPIIKYLIPCSGGGAVGNPMSQQAKDAYNSGFEPYIGDKNTATDIKNLIDNVIMSNNENIGNSGKFVEIEVDESIKDRLEINFEDEKPFGTAGTNENNQEYVEKVFKNLEKLKSSIKAYVNSKAPSDSETSEIKPISTIAQYYYVEVEYSAGIVVLIKIQEI